MEWSTKVTMEFLDLYEKEPIIWNPNLKYHKDRSQVYDAWKRIRSALSIECSLKELKKKKETLMATYRKLSIRVKKSKRSGSKSLYEPVWFAYDKMAAFLDSVYTPRVPIEAETPQNEQDSDEEYLQYTEDETTFNDPIETSGKNFILHGIESNDVAATETTALYQSGGLSPVAKKRRVVPAGHIEKRMNEAYHLLKQVAAKPKEEKDEISMFCELLCSKLRALDEDTRDLAMHEINNLMFGLKKQPNVSFQSTYQQPSYVQVAHGSTEYEPCNGATYVTVNSPQDGSNDIQKEEPCQDEEGC